MSNLFIEGMTDKELKSAVVDLTVEYQICKTRMDNAILDAYGE